MRLVELWKVTKAEVKMELTIKSVKISEDTLASMVRNLQVNNIDFKNGVMVIDLKVSE